MDAELFIHGPRHAFYGKQEDSQYCQSFDSNQIKDEKRFVVEVRNVNGKLYVYYTYCRYLNIFDIDGRAGAYIGITIRFDAYYSNLRNLYTLLEAIFESKIVGLLVEKVPLGYRYIVNDFKNLQQSILNTVEKSIGVVLMTILTPNEVIDLDSSFRVCCNEVIKAIDDNQYSAECIADVKNIGRLVFASSKELGRVVRIQNDCKDKIIELEEKHRLEISQKDHELEELKQTISDLRSGSADNDKLISAPQGDNVPLKSTFQPCQTQGTLAHCHEPCTHNLHEGNTTSHQGERRTSQKKGHSSDRVDGDPFKCVVGFIDRNILIIVVIVSFILLGFAIWTYLDAEDKEIVMENLSSNNQCTKIPNELTERLFPYSKPEEILREVPNSGDSVITLELLKPNVSIENYVWIIKSQDIKELREVTSEQKFKFKPATKGEYNARVFVNDTMIAFKKIIVEI